MATTHVTLDFPIKVAGVEVSKLGIRRPKVSDLSAAQRGNASDADKEIRLIANLCGITPAEAEEIDLKDWKKLQETVQGFQS